MNKFVKLRNLYSNPKKNNIDNSLKDTSNLLSQISDNPKKDIRKTQSCK